MYASQSQDTLNNTSTSKFLNQDSWMADLDPILQGGYKVAFHQPFPVQIRQSQSDNKTIHAHRDILTMRILVRPSIQNYSQIKLQITSQNDIFKSYICYIDQKRFQRLRKIQSLNFPFMTFLNMIIKQFNLCYKNPQQYFAFLHINPNVNNKGQNSHHSLNPITTISPKLQITQNIQYKSIQLLALQFEELDDQLNRQYISYRFSYMKAKNQRVQTKIRQVFAILKLKNPNLLNSILKKNSMLQRFINSQ